jgi:hypothetical protein
MGVTLFMRRSTVLLLVSLLAASAFVVAAGSGAISSFSADRAANMVVVDDTSAFVAVTGDSEHWAFEDDQGRFYLDFTDANENADGEGFNPQARTVVEDAFSITNQSTKPVYVWLESEDWPWQANAILDYRINEDNTTGDITRADVWFYANPAGLNLRCGGMTPFVDGVGQAAYVHLEPGEAVAVNVIVDTANSVYGNQGLDLSHTITVEANEEAPTHTGGYH